MKAFKCDVCGLLYVGKLRLPNLQHDVGSVWIPITIPSKHDVCACCWLRHIREEVLPFLEQESAEL